MFKKLSSIMMGIMFFGIGLSANTKPISHKNIKTPFNLNKVIEQVIHHPVREGEEIIIKGRVYKAIFKEGKVILRARDKDPSGEDVIIPVEGIPEIRGDKVVYGYGYGQEIAFEGKREGIRFREINPAHQPAQMKEYIGNIAKLKEEYSKDGIKSGEFLLDTNVVYVGAAYNQYTPSIAFDGTSYFVVWEDRRNGSYSDIYGTRVSTSGTILDTAGIPISTGAYWQKSPSIAFDGTNYFVVWQDYRNPSYDIYGARVSTSGVVLDTAGFPISTAANNQEYPSVVFDSTNYLVVWQDGRSGAYGNIYGARISTSGVVLDTAGIPISTETSYQGYPSIAFDGTNYFVVWTDGNIHGTRIDASGTVLDTASIPISTATNYQGYPSIAFDGTNYFVVWSDGRSGSYDIYGARIDTSGTVLDTAGIPISTEADLQEFPSIAFDGRNYLVVWQDYRSGLSDIYGARVSISGVVLDTTGILISTAANYQYVPSIAFDGTNYFVVWSDGRSSSYDIYGARIDTSGTVLDTAGIPISTAAYYQYSPSIAFDGTNYLVVWEDYRSDTTDIYGARIDASGTVLDTAGIPISTATGYQEHPSIASGGTNYLVVWQDYRNSSYSDIYGARIDTSGVVLDTSGIPISTATDRQESPSVAFDGTNYLVVWKDARSSIYDDIYGARIDTSGVVLDTAGIPISTATDVQGSPSIAFDGTNYFVVWRDYRSGSDYDIYGARMDTSGTILDTAGIPISTAAGSQCSPSIAFNGTNYLVVWEDERNGSNYDIYSARVSISGEVLDTAGIPISTSADWEESPSVAFDGTNYLVVWRDYRSGLSDIYGARVSTSGTVIDSFPVSTQSGNQFSPAIAKGSGTQMFVVYSGWTDSINGKPANTMRIWGKFSPFTGIREKPNAELGMRDAEVIRVSPNPFARETVIRYSISGDNDSRLTPYALRIYDIAGRLVKTLLNKSQESGYYTIKWDGTNNVGRKLSSGIYFIRLNAGKYTQTKKIVLMR